MLNTKIATAGPMHICVVAVYARVYSVNYQECYSGAYKSFRAYALSCGAYVLLRLFTRPKKTAALPLCGYKDSWHELNIS
jgi:hypothetical protein